MLDGSRAPVGQAWTHSPQATQVLAPIGSPWSNTICSWWPRPAMPMTSLTWTSRQARTQRLHWMQASSCTVMAGCDQSAAGWWRAGNRLPSTSIRPAQSHSRLPGSCASARAGWSATSSSMTIRRAVVARSVAVATFMPAAGLRMHDAASTRSPSISTMQARQLPSAR